MVTARAERSIEDQKRVATLKARATLGERLSPADFALVVKHETFEESVRLTDQIDADKAMTEVIGTIFANFAALKIVAYEKRCVLEDRLAALEAAQPKPKPRVKVAAPTRPA